jgi:hypothetical protein
LFFAVAAVQHAAPLPPMRLARIDEIDLAVGCAALSDTTVIGHDKRRSLRRIMPRDDSAAGNPDPRRMAEADGLDGGNSDFSRRLCRNWWATASIAAMMAAH